MKKPINPCYRPGSSCDKRTITCKVDGSCPYGYKEYEKVMSEYRMLIAEAKMADRLDMEFYVRRKYESERKLK